MDPARLAAISHVALEVGSIGLVVREKGLL
jgi:hypothetical protein